MVLLDICTLHSNDYGESENWGGAYHVYTLDLATCIRQPADMHEKWCYHKPWMDKKSAALEKNLNAEKRRNGPHRS